MTTTNPPLESTTPGGLTLTPAQMQSRIVRHADLVPCKTAFIDAHTPGSDKKDNFTIIGAGVSESPEQHIHIRDTPGFNIGAAGQPPNCRNSLHSHSTAEVFFVLTGRWRFFWGRFGTAGEVVLEHGDMINIPTGMFRGFENIGSDYGMIMAVLGGDDAGGGVAWAPEVISDAKAHGLVLGENGVLYDTKRGQSLPSTVRPMPLMDDGTLAQLANPTSKQVEQHFVARYAAMTAAAADKPQRPISVLGANGLLIDRPGFEIDFLSQATWCDLAYQSDRDEVLMVLNGDWALQWTDGQTLLGAGDTCLLPAGLNRLVKPAGDPNGGHGLFRVRRTHDPAGPTQWPAP